HHKDLRPDPVVLPSHRQVVGGPLEVLGSLERQVGVRLGDAERTLRGVYGADRSRYGVMTFREVVAMREGLLAPDRPPAKGLSGTDPFPAPEPPRAPPPADPVPADGPQGGRGRAAAPDPEAGSVTAHAATRWATSTALRS